MRDADLEPVKVTKIVILSMILAQLLYQHQEFSILSDLSFGLWFCTRVTHIARAFARTNAQIIRSLLRESLFSGGASPPSRRKETDNILFKEFKPIYRLKYVYYKVDQVHVAKWHRFM